MRIRAALAALGILGGVVSAASAAPGPDNDAKNQTFLGGVVASDLLSGALSSAALDARVCRKIRSVAARFGESWAGYRVRQMLNGRICGAASEELAEHDWTWPWRPGPSTVDVPPMLMGSIGDWDVRCGEAGKRVRCALVHQIDVPGSADRIVTHFVISAIGGRETVLWRIAAPRSLADAHRTIAIRAGDHQAQFNFEICFARSCVAEVESQDAAAAIDSFWNGQPISLTLGDGGDVPVPAAGFRHAFRELMRLRDAEPGAAGRR